MGGLFRVFRVVRLVVVGALCLLIGVAARQLFDAYGPDMMLFLKKKPAEAEIHIIQPPPPGIPTSREPVETF
jgi:hypothetical protein